MQTSTPLRPSHAAFEDDSLAVSDASLILGPNHSNLFLPVLTPPQQRADPSVRPSRLFDVATSTPEDRVSQEQAIQALRAQLDTQRALVVQFEVDLEAGDEMVSMLKEECARYREDRNRWRDEAEQRATATRVLRAKIAELEHLCHNFEAYLEHTREEAVERSITDAASNSAMQELRQELETQRAMLDAQARDTEIRLALEAERTRALERENERLHAAEDTLRRELGQARDAEVQLDGRLRELEAEMGVADASLHEDDSCQVLNPAEGERDFENQSGYESLMIRMRDLKLTSEDTKSSWQQRAAAWEEERALLKQDTADRIGKLNTQIDGLREKNSELERRAGRKDGELKTLHDELEAQWKNTESMGETIKNLQTENQDLQNELHDLQEQRAHLEEDKALLEARLEDEEETTRRLMDVRSETSREVETERKQAGELNDLLHDADTKRQQAQSTVATLEAALQDSEAHCEDLMANIKALEDECDNLRSRVSTANSRYDNAVSEQRQATEDANQAQQAMREAKDHAELLQRQLDEVEAQLKERTEKAGAERESVESLGLRVATLNRQVEELRRKNTNAEFRFAALKKERDELEETAGGLNIALEAKQQEVDLVKRSHGVRGVGGMTPATSNRRSSITRISTGTVKRDSTLWTPLITRGQQPPRPESAASTASSTHSVRSETSRRSSISESVSKPGRIRRTVSSAGESGPLVAPVRECHIAKATGDDTPQKRPLGTSNKANEAAGTPSTAKQRPRVLSVSAMRRPSSPSVTSPTRPATAFGRASLAGSKVQVSPPTTAAKRIANLRALVTPGGLNSSRSTPPLADKENRSTVPAI